jgi:hypothetical protein
MNKLLQHIMNAGDVDHKILPGLQKMQKAGLVMFKPPASEKAVNDNIPNAAIVRKKLQEDFVAKQVLAKRAADQAFRDRQGYIRQAEAPRSVASKAWAIATNPMTAFAYKAQGKDIPDNFERGPKNSLDIAVNMVNPFSYVNEAKEFGKGVGNIAYKGVTDPFSLNGMDFLNTAMHGVGAIPFVAESVQGANLLSKGLRGATTAYKGTAGMTSKLGRVKNAANAGAIELGYIKGDINGHSYFNIPADEVSKMMTQEMVSLPKGAYSFDGNMSKNSAPLFWTQAARSPKGFTAVNPGTTQSLNWSGTMGKRVSNALPKNIESIMPDAPRYIQDLENRIDLLKKIGNPYSLQKAAKLEKEGISPQIISDLPYTSQVDYNVKKSFGEFLNNYKTTLDNPIIEVNRKTGLGFPMTKVLDKNVGNNASAFYEQPSIYMVKGNPLSRVPKIVGEYAGKRADAFFGGNRNYENPRIPFILTNAAYNAGMNIASQKEQRYGGENNLYKVFAEEGVEYKGPSIVDYLATKGYSGKKAFRKDLAEKYGVEDYNYSAAKNTELLNKLRADDALLQEYDQQITPIPVERMMEMERQARTAREAAPVTAAPTSNQRPANPAPVYNYSPEFQNMRIPQTKVNTSLQPKVIYDNKFSLSPQMVVQVPSVSSKPAPTARPNQPRPTVTNTTAVKPQTILPKFDPFSFLQNTNQRPLGPVVLNKPAPVNRPASTETQKVGIPGISKPIGNKFMFANEYPYLFNKQKSEYLPQVVPANKPAVKTEKYTTESEVEEKPWYEEVVDDTSNFFSRAYDSFAESVNKSPLDFRGMSFGSTGISPKGATEMTRDLTKNILSFVSPDLAQKFENKMSRQDAINNPKERKSSLDPSKIKFDPIVVTGDTIPDTDRRYHIPELMDLDYMRFGVRNRGDYKEIQTEGAPITTFEPFQSSKQYFAKSKDPANATYIGVAPDGKIKVGGKDQFQDQEYQITKTFGNKVVDFNRDEKGVIKKVASNPNASRETLSPSVKVMGDDGKIIDGKLSLLLPREGNQEESFDLVTGGRYIFQTPDGKTKLVSGSLKNIETAFYNMKKNNPYVNVITLDNGSYARGIRTYDQKLTKQDLKGYDNQNTGGGNIAYILPGASTRYESKFSDFEKEAKARLQAKYPGKKVSVGYQDTGLYDKTGGRDIETQAAIQQKGNSQTPVSLHNFGAARDYILYVDGKPIDAGANKDLYADILWTSAAKTGLHHVGTKEDNWDPTHIGLAKEGQKTAFDELYSKYPDIFANPNFVKSLNFVNKNKSNPNYREYYELLNNIQPFTGQPRTTETMRTTAARKQEGGPIIDPRGQWAYPGKVTRIPSPNITMQGVPYPVFGVGSNGQKQMMYPEQEYNFGGASYVDEYPMMKNGGGLLSKTVSCSNCGWSWKAVEGGIDPLNCHKCGGTVKMKNGGQHGKQPLEKKHNIKVTYKK